MNRVEIMAPAGSYEALACAIEAGADSIYFGAGSLNMRSRSSANFQLDDIKQIAKKCQKCRIKSYLVVNTIVYDEEFEEIRRICDTAKQAGISAIIAHDMAVIEYANSIALPVHISVQANVSNIQALKFYAKFAEAVVLARELSLQQIKAIIYAIETENITGTGGKLVEIEIFAHGALCVSISGKCYMSLATYNSSANRGACFQNCRREYRVIDEQTGDELIVDNKFVMSPKDICTVNVLDSILDTGVSILKIEGRGRSPDYVHTVTNVYREAADAYYDNSFSTEKVGTWIERLKKVFNRGFWMGGYYLGEKLGEWCGVNGNLATQRKIYIGRVTKYFTKIKVAEFALDAAELKTTDEIMITGPTTGVVKHTISEMRINDGEKVHIAPQNSIVSILIEKKVRKNDKLYRLVEKKFGE